jgi:hypothetical protein
MHMLSSRLPSTQRKPICLMCRAADPALSKRSKGHRDILASRPPNRAAPQHTHSAPPPPAARSAAPAPPHGSLPAPPAAAQTAVPSLDWALPQAQLGQQTPRLVATRPDGSGRGCVPTPASPPESRPGCADGQAAALPKPPCRRCFCFVVWGHVMLVAPACTKRQDSSVTRPEIVCPWRSVPLISTTSLMPSPAHPASARCRPSQASQALHIAKAASRPRA